MRKRTVVTLFGAVVIGWLGCLLAYADTAEVLPKGRFDISVESKFYLPTKKRYNPDGDLEDIAVDFNSRLDSRVFPGLGQLEQALGLPPGSASIGDSIVSFKYEFTDLLLRFSYGLTRRLSIGVVVPYYFQKTKVSATVDTSQATVGKNPFINSLAPLSVPGTVPLTDDDVRALLSNGLDITGDGTIEIPGFGYKRFESWSDEGFGDLEAGFRYQYFNNDLFRLAFTGGARFPTGAVDDPDNLVDFPFGDGAYALLFRSHNDIRPTQNLLLDFTFRYDLILPDKQTLRVLDDVNQPITANKTKVDRNIGDVFRFRPFVSYTVVKGFSLTGQYEYAFKLKDKVSGEGDFAFSSLEDETNWTSHIFWVGASYSTIPLFIEKKFPLPFIFSFAYRDRFAGSNNVLNTKFFSLELRGFF
jgi:hypothetical protein